MSKRITALLATGALAAGGALAAAPAVAAPGTTSLASVLAADGNRFDRNWDDFDIVDRAVNRVLAKKPGSAVAVLADGDTAVTAFIPSDRAFRRLVFDLAGARLEGERGVWRAVKGVADTDTLETILLYHVVPGATVTYQQARRADGAALATAADGATVEVKVVKRVSLIDADTDDKNARVIVPARNINRGNAQIAHGINRVLRPIDL